MRAFAVACNDNVYFKKKSFFKKLFDKDKK